MMAWSWNKLITEYRHFRAERRDTLALAKRLGITLPLQNEMAHIEQMHADRAEIVSRAYLNVKRVSHHLNQIEAEIERRNALVGSRG